MTSSNRATLIGASALVIWSTLAVLTTFTGAVPPFQLVAMTFPLAFVLAFIKWMIRRESPRAMLRQPIGAWALGVGGLFVYHALLYLALRAAPPLEANLLNYLWPLLIVLFSAPLAGEKLKPRHIAGAAAGLFGAGLLIAGKGGIAFDPRFLLGYGAAVAAAFTWSLYSVLNRKYGNVPSDAVAGFCGVTAIFALVCHLLFETTVWPQGSQWVAILALGLGPTGLAFFVWDYGCKHGNIRALGALAYFTPLLSNGLLILFGEQPLSFRIAVAALLIIGGAALGAGDLMRRGRAT